MQSEVLLRPLHAQPFDQWTHAARKHLESWVARSGRELTRSRLRLLGLTGVGVPIYFV